jgi:hypothetical protein
MKCTLHLSGKYALAEVRHEVDDHRIPADVAEIIHHIVAATLEMKTVELVNGRSSPTG